MSSVSIGKVIDDILRGDSDFNAIVNGRIYPIVASQGDAQPYCVYDVLENTPHFIKQVASPVDTFRVSVTHYSTNYDTARDMAEKARTALDQYAGTVEGILVDRIFYQRENDDYEHAIRMYFTEQQYTIRVKP